jgi:hypothetical protein
MFSAMSRLDRIWTAATFSDRFEDCAKDLSAGIVAADVISAAFRAWELVSGGGNARQGEAKIASPHTTNKPATTACDRI